MLCDGYMGRLYHVLIWLRRYIQNDKDNDETTNQRPVGLSVGTAY